jgi:hypothetical protein
VSVVDPVTGPDDAFMTAVIVVVPEPAAVARPVELIVATSLVLEAHVT